MGSKNVLVVYYSRSGTTRAVAQTIARLVDADVEEILDTTDRHGVLGYARSAVDAMRGRSTTLAPQRLDPADYGLVLVGTPVWGSRVSAPVRVYLHANRNQFPRAVGFFLTEGGRGARRVFAEMARIIGKEPTATLALKQRDVARAIEPTRAFAATLEKSGSVPVSAGSAHAPVS